MPDHPTPRKLGLSEAFTRPQSRAVPEIGRWNLLTAFEFDGGEPQLGCAAAYDQDAGALHE